MIVGVVVFLKGALKIGQHLLDLLLAPAVFALENIHGEFPVGQDL